MPYTQVSNLDFNQIKASLKEYMRAQSDFTDYDFEGSTLSVLLDTLAYNTYYTAFNTNMVVNELFIDSATLRDNVVALAKQLGYRPKSATSPTAYISFTVTYTNATTDTELLLKKGMPSKKDEAWRFCNLNRLNSFLSLPNKDIAKDYSRKINFKFPELEGPHHNSMPSIVSHLEIDVSSGANSFKTDIRRISAFKTELVTIYVRNNITHEIL